MSGWFVTTTITKPARLSSPTAVGTPGRILKSSSRHGATGRPSRSMLAFSTPSRSRNTARATISSHHLQLRMRDQAVPDDRLKCFRVRRHAQLGDRRHDHNNVADLARIAAVAADNTENLKVPRFGFLQGLDQIGANVTLQVATTNGKHEDCVSLVGAAHFEPLRKDGAPALVVRARGQLGYIVRGRIALYTAQLAKR